MDYVTRNSEFYLSRECGVSLLSWPAELSRLVREARSSGKSLRRPYQISRFTQPYMDTARLAKLILM